MIGRSIPLSVLTICLTASICRAGEPGGGRHCRPVGGTVTTNFVSDTTTLGTVTGDLRGAVSATLLGQAPGANDTIVFTVQHHWVTDDGDTILLKVATATANHNRAARCGSVMRVRCHCQPPRLVILKPCSIQARKPYQHALPALGARSVSSNHGSRYPSSHRASSVQLRRRRAP